MDFTEAYDDTSSSVGLVARIGNSVQLQQLLKDGYPTNGHDNRGWRPLHEAAANGHTECVRLLIMADDVAIEAVTHEGQSALLLACQQWQPEVAQEVVKQLLIAGADPDMLQGDTWCLPLPQVMDNTEESLLKLSNSNGSGFKKETEENLRQRSTKHTDDKENDTTAPDSKHQSNGLSNESIYNAWDKFPCWSQIHHSMLPQWLQDNEFLHYWHRPPLQSSVECFKSIFKLHTETGNIWTHLLGCVGFIAVMIYFITMTSVVLEEKFILCAFFAGAILCLGFSTTFHTLMCHSEVICDSFRKIDYCGISCLIMGSTVPWIYFIFYCDYTTKFIYISMDVILGTITIIFSLWDRFGTPEYRAIRSISFVIFGLAAVIPAVHYMFIMDWNEKINTSAMQSTFLLAALYILGAAFYGTRIPEIFFPGKCDLWIQSHQIFHILVIAGAYVTYQVLMELSDHRHTYIECCGVNIPSVKSGNVTNDV